MPSGKAESSAGPRETASGFTPIEDYAALGNCHSVALVSRNGSIDWWCPQRFDHPSVFAAILDESVGGRFSVRFRDPVRVERRYLEGTNVLETEFQGRQGALRLVDCVPVAADEHADCLDVHHGIVRRLECTAGRVDVDVVYEPRWDYGRIPARLKQRGSLGLYTEHRADALVLRSQLPLEITPGGEAARGSATLHAGDRARLVLSFARREPLVISDLGAGVDRTIQETADWWRRWSDSTTYDGPYRDAVRRSGLVLRMLAFAPSGAIVAAPTTSLPEQIGGDRNWDYRYCWLRDASMTVEALLELGDAALGEAFLNWMLHATHLTQPDLGVLYDVFGHGDVEERTLDHLSGYRRSSPVRVGNAASSQLQLDVYGEVAGAAKAFVARGGILGNTRGKILRGLGETVCRRWREPDHGIWEVRSGRRHHTLSKVQCWRALDDLLDLAERGHLEVPVERFRSEREAIREAVETSGWSDERRSYVSWFGGSAVDASLLLLGLHGYVAAGAPRMRATWECIRGDLEHDGMLRRYGEDYADGVKGSEGTFGICTFWAAAYLAALGRVDEARKRFERMLGHANDVGLYAEEIDASSGAFLGNFPQAFTHVGLVTAAMAIRRAESDGNQPRAGGE
jgi:GH15 family glucan-1,4-alpha-glucosidase